MRRKEENPIQMHLRQIHESLTQLRQAGRLPAPDLLDDWPEDELDPTASTRVVCAVLRSFEREQAWARSFEEAQRIHGAAFMRSMDQVVRLAMETLAHSIVEAVPSATEYLQEPGKEPAPTAALCVCALATGLRIASFAPQWCRMHLARCSGAVELADRALVLLASATPQEAQSSVEHTSVTTIRSALELIHALSASSIRVCKALVRSSEAKTRLLLRTLGRVLALPHNQECFVLVLRILDVLLRIEPLRADVVFTSPVFAAEIGALVAITLEYLGVAIAGLGWRAVTDDSEAGADRDMPICAVVVTRRLLKIGAFPIAIAAWITPAIVVAFSSAESAFRRLAQHERTHSMELCIHVVQLLGGLLETEGYGAVLVAEIQRQQRSTGAGAVAADTLRLLVAASPAEIAECQWILLRELLSRSMLISL
jgi:hypothetical protein